MQVHQRQTKDYKIKIIKELERLPDSNYKLFTIFEDEMITKYYPSKGSMIAKVLGKTRGQITRRASKLGVRFNGK